MYATPGQLGPMTSVCERCGAEFTSKREARYCSAACRARASEQRRGLTTASVNLGPVGTTIAEEKVSAIIDTPSDLHDVARVYLERSTPSEPTPRERVAAWRAWDDGGRHGAEPPQPSLADCLSLSWPGNAIMAKQLYGYTVPDEPAPVRLA